MNLEELVQLDDALEHRGIVVTPLFPRRDPVAAYLTLDEAPGRGLRATEVDEAATVPELVVRNPLDERVLLYDGEELVGAKQNRTLNVSVLVEQKTTLRIPVSCVEQGRWRRDTRDFEAAPHISNSRLRHRKAEALAARPLARGVAQGEVWDEVRQLSMRMSVDSPTGAAADVHRAHAHDVRALEDAFPAEPGQCGAILGLDEDLCLDLVSRPDAFARLWPKLRAGYLLDALDRAARPSGDDPVGDRVLPRGRPRGAHDPAALGRARRGRAPAGRARHRLRARARGRGHPTLGVHERGRGTQALRSDRAAEQQALILRS
ncbi:MAG: hypothetical protein KatS3mg012_1401 [Gaiellaceae bacterium]|nr:MAG: hypothetical protein KatS3mg012_1401 [Gaiellaceae bacterium]